MLRANQIQDSLGRQIGKGEDLALEVFLVRVSPDVPSTASEVRPKEMTQIRP